MSALPYRRLRRGMIIHVTSYGWMPCDMWAIIDTDYNDMGNATGLYFYGDNQAINMDIDGRGIFDETDEGVIVPAEKLPDELCAALAKWRLSQ